MIQKAHFIADKEGIIRLWRRCFGDSKHYVEFFLENCPAENALFLYHLETENVGMMFLMPGKLTWSEQTRKIYYLYALCVDENYRNKGIAGELIDFAKEFAKNDNAEICLVPSTEKLRNYYAARGFLDVFACTEQQIDVEAECMFPIELETDIVTDIDLLVKARAKLYKEDSFLWGKNNLEFALMENSYSTGFAYFVSEEGQSLKADDSELTVAAGIPYIIGDIEDGVLQIRETNLQLFVIYRLAAKYNCSKVRFLNMRTPFEKYAVRTVPYAMMTNQLFTEDFIKNTMFYERYINFCFD